MSRTLALVTLRVYHWMTLIHRTYISPTLLSLRIALKSYLFTRCHRVPLIRLATTRVAVNDYCARYKCVSHAGLFMFVIWDVSSGPLRSMRWAESVTEHTTVMNATWSSFRQPTNRSNLGCNLAIWVSFVCVAGDTKSSTVGIYVPLSMSSNISWTPHLLCLTAVYYQWYVFCGT